MLQNDKCFSFSSRIDTQQIHRGLAQPVIYRWVLLPRREPQRAIYRDHVDS